MPRPTGHHKDPTRQAGYVQLGAFEYVVLNPMSETGSVLMKITLSDEVWTQLCYTVTTMLQHHLLP